MNFQNVEFLISAASTKDFPKTRLPEIAFAGKSNVGKSSVINRILQRKNFARVGDKPGKTIHVNYFTVDKCCYFVDLPGYGYAKREQSERKRWAELMEGYFQSQRNISLVFQLIDMRHSPTADDMTMLNFLKEMEIPFVIALTKWDKLNKTETEKRREALESELADYADIKRIEFSAVKGTGVEEMKAAIEAALRSE